MDNVKRSPRKPVPPSWMREHVSRVQQQRQWERVMRKSEETKTGQPVEKQE